MDRFERQVRFLGTEGQQLLGQLVLFIAGGGGLGSALAVLAAYMGVGGLILCDDDTVDETNLNRNIGTVPRDALLQRAKVDVLARTLRAIRPDAYVLPLKRRVENCADEIRGCDMILGGVDSQTGRHYLNHFPSQYLIPYVDVGTGITVQDSGVSEIYGQVRLGLPDGPCLHCMDGIDFEALRWEALDDEERDRERDVGYGVPDEPAPSVISLNTALASIAMTEVLNLVGGFRKPCNYIFYDAMRPNNMVRVVEQSKDPDCPVCGWDSFARGDAKPLPTYTRNKISIPPWPKDDGDAS